MTRINVDSVLCCSAGGVAAAFFTLGAIERLLEKDEFLNKFEVISASSGSVVPVILIELCYDNNLITEKNWFYNYVVKPMYNFFKSDYIISIISSLSENNNDILWKKLSSFYDDIPKLKSSSKSKEINKPIFCYNYIDITTLKLTYDNSDLINDKDKISKIIFRCTMPLNNANNISSIDAAFTNMFGTNILDDYNPKKITICSKINYLNFNKSISYNIIHYFYQKAYKYSKKYTEKLLKNTDLSIITISSSKYPSKDKYHNKVFEDNISHFTSNNSIYVLEYDKMKIFENEGYLQCNEMLKYKKNENNENNFRIPNKSVYKNAKKIMSS